MSNSLQELLELMKKGSVTLGWGRLLSIAVTGSTACWSSNT